jgi:peptide/nickel transport system substrate-binding protein
MALDKKRLRYAYWVTVAFFKKNIQSIVLSCILSIITVITVISLSPFLLKLITNQKQVIGVVGTYNVNNVPDFILAKISNGLLFVNEKGEIVPLIADSWEQTKNGQEYRFHLKKGLLWNNGKPFTAKEIQYGFKDVETEVQGDNMIIFKLKKPLQTFPNYLTKPIVKSPLIGVAGLYRIEKARVKFGEVKELQLSPNKENQPILIYRFYDSETKLINAYKLGEIDQMVTNKKTVADAFESWKNTEITKTIDYSQAIVLFFNLENPLLKEDKDVRHAIAMTIPHKKFTDIGDKADGPIPPISWAYNPNTKKIQYDPTLAEKILRKYNTGSDSATLTLSTFYDYISVADEIKQGIEQAGIKTKVVVLSSNQPTGFDMLLASLRLPPDPDQYFYWHSLQTEMNITHYKNVKIDKLLEEGRNVFDIETRKKIYADFQKVMADDMPAHFLYYPYTYTIKRK